jgi:hypothetical protein
MYTALRLAAYAGLDDHERRALVGGTMLDVLEKRPLADPGPPRLPPIRSMSGRLTRVNGYLLGAFAAAIGAGPPPDPVRALPFIALARAACRDPDPGAVGPTLQRIDELLTAAEQLVGLGREQARGAFGLVIAAGVIAATEPLTPSMAHPDDRGGSP